MGQYISLIPNGLLSLEKRFLFASALHLQYDVEVCISKVVCFAV